MGERNTTETKYNREQTKEVKTLKIQLVLNKNHRKGLYKEYFDVKYCVTMTKMVFIIFHVFCSFSLLGFNATHQNGLRPVKCLMECPFLLISLLGTFWFPATLVMATPEMLWASSV